MFNGQLLAATNAGRRFLPSLGLTAILLTSTLGASVSAQAD